MEQPIMRINNIPVKDLLTLLNQISKDYELVDLIIDPEKRKVTLNPVGSPDVEDWEDLPEEDQELREDNIYDII